MKRDASSRSSASGQCLVAHDRVSDALLPPMADRASSRLMSLPRVAGRRIGGRRSFIDNRSERHAVFVGQIVGPGQMSQERRERAFTEQLGQRPQPAADQLITVKHGGEHVYI